MGGLLWILVTVMVFVSILGDLSLCISECGMSKTRVNYCRAWPGFLDRLDSLLSVFSGHGVGIPLAGWPV